MDIPRYLTERHTHCAKYLRTACRDEGAVRDLIQTTVSYHEAVTYQAETDQLGSELIINLLSGFPNAPLTTHLRRGKGSFTFELV